MARNQQQTTEVSPQAETPHLAAPTPKEHDSLLKEMRRLLAELVGTFALVVVGAGGVVINATFSRDVDSAAHYAASGLIVMAMIYALGETSGAHINPAITFAFALRHDFPWRRVPGYWLAQVLGSLLAALLIHLLFGTTAHLGAPQPHMGSVVTFATETLLTFLLVTVVLGIATKGELVGNNVALAVGGTVALCGFFAGSISGASMNPARALGPYLVSGEPSALWLYVAAPFVGALLAVGMAWLLRGKTTAKAVEAAKGN